jgi:S-DNA-T family DNA segregation ATPase FtsK/SpoIIIE
MTKKTTGKRTTKSKKQTAEGINLRPEFIGVLLLILAGLTVLSLITPNRGWAVSVWLATLGLLIGWGRYIFWLVLGMLAVWFFKSYSQEDSDEKWEKPVGTFLLLGELLVTFNLIAPGKSLEEPGAGGIIGWLLGEMLRSTLGAAGTVVVLLGVLPLILIMVSGLSFRELMQMIRDQYYRYQDWRHFRQLPINQPLARTPLPPPAKPNLLTRMFAGNLSDELPPPPELPLITEDGVPLVLVGTARELPPRALPAPPSAPTDEDARPLRPTTGNWRLPPVNQVFELGSEMEISEREIHKRVKIIEDTMEGFNIKVQVREINPGPTVTRFSLALLDTRDLKGKTKKVRVSRVVNLQNDLALALAASPIRIEAPIPGQSYIGIEVPNSNKNVVALRNMMESDKFVLSNAALKLALGQNVAGQTYVADLSKMPHLLVAGATGSGKSVCVNAIVACLLCTHTPETLRMLMIDPKMVELVSYNGIPHLLAPVVTELEKAVGVLSWATREMDRRYKIFAKERVRNLEAYNDKMIEAGHETLPYIVIIIDELADLMMMAPDEVERTVARLAQMARATGLHLIIATQRPSVDVVTGLIKANFPARIAFAVTSQIDSRVILDSPGAEQLLGKGDMLYMAADSAKLQRLQGVFVSDAELNRLVQFWRGTTVTSEDPRPARGPIEPPTNLIQQPLWEEYQNMGDDATAAKGEDDLLDKAIAEVRSQGKASVSMLQRRLRIGYARAARLIDELEAQGIIGADEGGGRARSVLVTQADDDADPLDEEE